MARHKVMVLLQLDKMKKNLSALRAEEMQSLLLTYFVFRSKPDGIEKDCAKRG